MGNYIKIPGGMTLRFVPASADTADTFLLRSSTTGDVTGLSSIPVNKLVALDPTRIVTTDASGFLTTGDAPNISITELNYLDGVTSNIQVQLDSKQGLANFTANRAIISDGTGTLDESTATDTEIGYVSGVTGPIQAQIDSKEPIITGGATSITSVNLLPQRLLISDISGKVAVGAATSAEASYLSGVVSPIQTQINNKLSATIIGPQIGNILYYTGSTWSNFPNGSSGDVLTYNGSTIEWTNPSVNGIPIGGTAGQFLIKNSGTNYDAGWHTFVVADVSDITATASEIDILAGSTVSNVEFNYLDGATSNIQVQIDSKLQRSLAYNAIWVGDAGNMPVQLGTGADGTILTSVMGAPVWQTPTPPGDVSGPGSSTDNAIARWNGISGDSLNNSGVIIDDTDNVSGIATLSTGQVSVLNQAVVRLYETGSTNYVGIRASGTMASDYTITLPDTAPSTDDYLKFDGANYIWAPASGAGVTSFIDLTDTDPTTYVGQAAKYVRVNAGETGLEFATLAAGGTVTSVTGTADRITITGTPTVAPVVDIASTYVGQTSITTLGTVATGTWNATNISLAKGGTGASLADPNADRIFFWDDSAGSTAFLTPGASLAITTTTIDVADNGITDARLRDSSALSVIGRASNSAGDPADIVASTDGHVLRRSGTTLGFGTLPLAAFSMNTARLLGRTTASTGAAEEITVTNGLTLTAGTVKLGGTLTEDTNILGGGFALAASNLSAIGYVSNGDITFSTNAGGSIQTRAGTSSHLLRLGESAGVIFNVGSDANGDLYTRVGGKFTRLPIGQAGQYLAVNDSLAPIWTNDIIEDVTTTTYAPDADDNGKIKRFTHASGCTITIPIDLPLGWSMIAYRGVGAGLITINSAGTFEGIANTIESEKVAATIYHRGSNIHVGLGSLGAPSGGGGSGTVTSVGLTGVSGILTVSGSPIVTSGTMTMALANQTANTIFAGPGSGASAAPTFRSMVLGDLPYETIEEVAGTTYLFLESDRNKIKHFTNAAGCTVTIPTGLTTGWASFAYRGATAGTITFASAGTYEGDSTTLATAKTGASIIHRGGDIHVALGSFGSGGGGGSGTVTSVDLTVPSFLSVAGNPITTSGTLAVSLSGTALPASSGGTGLTSIGTSNQILAVNNAGTALEYKTLSTSTTAVSNDVGVTLGGAGAIVINIPSASATVRGVTTTGTQTFAGAKTYNSILTVGSTSSAGVQLSASSGVITLYTSGGANPIGISTSGNFFYTQKRWQTPGITFTDSGNTADTTASVLTGSGGLTTHSARFQVNQSAAGFTFDSTFSSAYGSGFTYDMVRVNPGGGTFGGSISSTFRQLLINPTYNFTGGASTVHGIFYSPVETGMVGVTHYGIRINSSSALSGFGLVTPTALVHIAGSSAARSGLRLGSGTAPTTGIQDGDIWHATDHLYARLGGVTYQLDQQGGGGGSGTVTSVSSGNLTPLFTSSVATATTTPAISYTLSNAAANTFFGNNTASSAAPSYTAMAALSRTNDTNVTLTLGGTPATALLKAVSLTLGWTGSLATTRGGTGTNTVTTGDLLYGISTNTWGKLAGVATGNVLISGGVSTAPSWGKVGLTTHVSGNLPVANLNSGTGASSSTFWRGDGQWAATISNTAASTELAMSNGTNLVPSGLFASPLGNIVMGSGSMAGSRLIEVASSSTNADLSLAPKGTGNIELRTNSTGIVYIGDGNQTGNRTVQFDTSSTSCAVSFIGKGTSSSGSFIFRPKGVSETFWLSLGSGGNLSFATNISASTSEISSFSNSGHNAGLSILTTATSTILSGGWADSIADRDFIIETRGSTASTPGGDLVLRAGTADVGINKGNVIIDSNPTGAGNRGYFILQDLPTSSAGLPSGALWRDAGAGNVLKIVP